MNCSTITKSENNGIVVFQENYFEGLTVNKNIYNIYKFHYDSKEKDNSRSH